jgi:hypothetical protein
VRHAHGKRLADLNAIDPGIPALHKGLPDEGVSEDVCKMSP